MHHISSFLSSETLKQPVTNVKKLTNSREIHDLLFWLSSCVSKFGQKWVVLNLLWLLYGTYLGFTKFSEVHRTLAFDLWFTAFGQVRVAIQTLCCAVWAKKHFDWRPCHSKTRTMQSITAKLKNNVLLLSAIRSDRNKFCSVRANLVSKVIVLRTFGYFVLIMQMVPQPWPSINFKIFHVVNQGIELFPFCSFFCTLFCIQKRTDDN